MIVVRHRIVSRAKAAGQPDLTAIQKIGIARDLHGMLRLQYEKIVKKVKPGSRVDAFFIVAGGDHLARPLADLVLANYNVRFYDFAEMAPSLLGSARYPVSSIYVRTVESGDIGYGEGGAREP